VKLDVPNFPQDPSKGNHEISFGKTIYIEQSDFKEVVYPLCPLSSVTQYLTNHTTFQAVYLRELVTNGIIPPSTS